MNRRETIFGLGAVSFGLGSALGTGAFSQMESGGRSVSVSVVDDSEAFLGLMPNEDYQSTFLNDEGKLTVALGGPEGTGVNPKSAYRVGMVDSVPLENDGAPGAVLPDENGDPTDDPAFKVINQSNQSQNVRVFFDEVTGSGDIQIFAQLAKSWDASTQTFKITPETYELNYTFSDVPIGEWIAASLIVDATDASVDDSVELSMEISAY